MHILVSVRRGTSFGVLTGIPSPPTRVPLGAGRAAVAGLVREAAVQPARKRHISRVGLERFAVCASEPTEWLDFELLTGDRPDRDGAAAKESERANDAPAHHERLGLPEEQLSRLPAEQYGFEGSKQSRLWQRREG